MPNQSVNSYRKALEMIYEGTARGPGQQVHMTRADVHKLAGEVLSDGPKHSTDLLAMYRMVRMEKFGFWDDCDEEHKETLREMSRRLCFATKHSE